ncbi:MAG: protocatechuate 3,4-dioxygenase subunit alpha [Gaiellales bacterium]
MGPFFAFALCTRPQNELLASDQEGAVRIRGLVLDGAGAPIPDAMVEIWQAAGRPGTGWARCGTNPSGNYSFVAARPKAVDGQAPHLAVLVFARGLLKPVMTRLYLPGDPANDSDPVLSALPPERAATMIAVAEGDVLRFDIRLQGDRETVFFAV